MQLDISFYIHKYQHLKSCNKKVTAVFSALNAGVWGDGWGGGHYEVHTGHIFIAAHTKKCSIIPAFYMTLSAGQSSVLLEIANDLIN